MIEIIKMIEILFEVILNVLLMFSLLSFLFILVISKLEKETYENEIDNMIRETLSEAFKNLDESNRHTVKQYLDVLKRMPFIERIIRDENKETKNSVSNRWLFTLIFTCIGFLVAIFLVFCFTVSHVSNLKLNIYHETGWAIFVFTMVCIFEATFFVLVAKRYVPIPPSTIVNAVIEVLKKW
jgi:hypothetical protein